jgi:hypothetical protein
MQQQVHVASSLGSCSTSFQKELRTVVIHQNQVFGF